MKSTMQLDVGKSNKPYHLIWTGVVFGIIYWLFESIRNMLNGDGSGIFEMIFIPDPMEFWMRVLVVCILVLFGVMSYLLQKKLSAKHLEKNEVPGRNIVIVMCLGFSLLYWLLESVRDVVIFNKGGLIERIFLPDSMSVWMRLLPILIVVLFGLYFNMLLADRKRLMDVHAKTRAVTPEKIIKHYNDTVQILTRAVDSDVTLNADDALMVRALVHLNIQKRSEAAVDFDRLLSVYPDSEHADKAAEYLKTL